MKKGLFMAAGVLLSIVCLYFILRHQDMKELLRTARTIHWGWVAISTLVFYAGFYLRAERWVAFFPPEPRLKGYRIVGPMMAGYALNSLFPGRVGEPARAYLVARRERVSIPAALSSVVAERLVDMATLLGMLAGVFALVPFGSFTKTWGKITLSEHTLREFARGTSLYLALPLTMVVILLMSSHFRSAVERIIQRMTFVPLKARTFGIGLMHSFAQGFQGLKSPVQAFLIIIYSLLIWGSAGWGIQLLAPAFGLNMSFLQGTAIMVIICIAITPATTPGYWGLYEAGFVFGAKVLGITDLGGRTNIDAQLVAMALLLHLIQYVPIIIWGMSWASMAGVSLRETARRASGTGDAVEIVVNN